MTIFQLETSSHSFTAILLHIKLFFPNQVIVQFHKHANMQEYHPLQIQIAKKATAMTALLNQ
jgi:hypothetical protein